MLLALVAMGGAACADDDEPEAAAPDPPTVTTAASVPLDLSGPVNDQGTATLGDSNRVGIQLDEFYFAPTYVGMIPAALSRTVTVLLSNAGTQQHTFTIEALAVDEELAPGDVRTIEVELRDIPVEYVCRFHAPQGMRGAISFVVS